MALIMFYISCFSHCFNPFSKKASSKFSLQSELYFTPAFVSEPFKFSIPTSPGHWPLQFATVSIGPLCVLIRPEHGDCTAIGFQQQSMVQFGSMLRKLPCPFSANRSVHAFFPGSYAWARLTVQPCFARRLTASFHFFLCRPAVLVGRNAEIAACDEINFF